MSPELIDLADRAERTEALQASIDDMKAGKVVPAVDVLTETRRILEKKTSDRPHRLYRPGRSRWPRAIPSRSFSKLISPCRWRSL